MYTVLVQEYILRYLLTSNLSVLAKIIFPFTFSFPRCKSCNPYWYPDFLVTYILPIYERPQLISLFSIFTFKNKINYYTPHYGSETILWNSQIIRLVVPSFLVLYPLIIRVVSSMFLVAYSHCLYRLLSVSLVLPRISCTHYPLVPSCRPLFFLLQVPHSTVWIPSLSWAFLPFVYCIPSFFLLYPLIFSLVPIPLSPCSNPSFSVFHSLSLVLNDRLPYLSSMYAPAFFLLYNLVHTPSDFWIPACSFMDLLCCPLSFSVLKHPSAYVSLDSP